MAVAISMVLLNNKAKLPVHEIEREIQSRHADLGPVEVSGDDQTATFKFKSADLILGNMPGPIPWPDLEGPCAASLLWKNATEDIRAHEGHIIVTVMADLSDIEQAITLTRGTAAVLAACQGAIGVFWTNATLIVPKPLFLEFTEKVLPHGPPLDIWVDFRVGRTTETTSAGFTVGMRALGHMEIEAASSPEKPSELRNRFQALARYLLENGAVVKDGDTFGNSASEKIRIVFGNSTFGNAGKVMCLQYAASSGKPWWKLW